MAIVVLPAVEQTLREGRDLPIQVRSDSDSLPAAMAAVRQAILELAVEDDDGNQLGPAYVSPAWPLPGSWLLIVDFGDTPHDAVLAVPELLVRQFEAAGVRDAVIGVPESSARCDLSTTTGLAARAYLRGPLAGRFGPAIPEPPLRLLDAAVGWLIGERQGGQETGVCVSGVYAPAPPDSLHPSAAAILGAPSPMPDVAMLAGNPSTRLVMAVVTGNFRNMLPQAALTIADTLSSGQDAATATAARMRRLRDTVRAAAGEIIWAGVVAEPDTARAASSRWDQPAVDPDDPSGTPPVRRHDVEQVADVLIPDAMWYQILTAGHLDRLGGAPPGAVELPDGRVELTIGAPEQWMPGHPDLPRIRQRARDLLAACLVNEVQARSMSYARLTGQY